MLNARDHYYEAICEYQAKKIIADTLAEEAAEQLKKAVDTRRTTERQLKTLNQLICDLVAEMDYTPPKKPWWKIW